MYKLIKRDDINAYDVYEEPSEKVLYRSSKRIRVSEAFNRLKGGAGFRGWTPDFILPDVDTKNRKKKTP